MELRKFIKTTIREYLNEQINQTQSKYFGNIKLKTEDVFDMIQYYDAYRDLYPNYSETENEYEEDYYFSTKEDAYNNVNETLEFFNSLPNPIPIYRSIKVESMDDINYEWLGDSWSFDKQSAINFAKNHTRGNVLLIGKTKFDNVNWNNTVKLWYLFSKTYDDYDENEINIIDSDEIFDVKIEKIQKKLNEDIFKVDNTIKKHEKLIIDAVINFLKNEWGFDANIIVKKKQSNNLIGDISLNDNSVNNNKFILHFTPKKSYIEIIKALIHELTHVKQVSKGELKPRSDWKGILWKNDFEISVREYKKTMKDFNKYKEFPWEKEAYNNMFDTNLRKKLFNSTYWEELKGKDATLDFIIDNI